MTLLSSIEETKARTSSAEPPIDRSALNQDAFRRMIAIERKRTERSGKPFLLMLLDGGNRHESTRMQKALDTMLVALQAATRETDVIGWYQDQTIVGAIFTGLVIDDKASILNTILTRVSIALRDKLTFEQFNQVSISFHFFPEEWDEDMSGRPSNDALYPDLSQHDQRKRALLNIKRLMDIAGSLLTLIVCLPVLLAIALAVKLSSRGPVFFRQQRVGQHGKCFTFLKFRSMYINNDHTAHKEYMTKMIVGDAAEPLHGKGEKVYKITNDKRITSVGKFLRRSSLDELPQFLNVLAGDMSLVGPRPAIPYEVASYQTWHRRRVLEVKPGITGLWQVNGRNRIKFDEMVRLDLQYAKAWSPWLDIKILVRTPGAVLKGAY
ncbi:sugar transferase [Acidobacterium sp. S8]|uniref:sugar transferase n=1 Tax=Acidobacterium sp. S8 TaxID=1641854 RepID=UPI00131E2860|nr:sugar transferase [Acidobacterium sp. S8]